MDLGLKIAPNNSYNYQEALLRGFCCFCNESLVWQLNLNNKNDDRFCVAVCFCGKKFYMTAETVLIKLGE
jgi:hypothetical protein